MAEIIEKSFEYIDRFPMGSVRYTFELLINDVDILGPLLDNLATTILSHLGENNIWNVKLGLNLTTDTVHRFGVNIQRSLDYNIVLSRLMQYTQSRRTLFGNLNNLSVEYTALLLHPTKQEEEDEDVKDLERRLQEAREVADRSAASKKVHDNFVLRVSEAKKKADKIKSRRKNLKRLNDKKHVKKK